MDIIYILRLFKTGTKILFDSYNIFLLKFIFDCGTLINFFHYLVSSRRFFKTFLSIFLRISESVIIPNISLLGLATKTPFKPLAFIFLLRF